MSASAFQRLAICAASVAAIAAIAVTAAGNPAYGSGGGAMNSPSPTGASAPADGAVGSAATSGFAV